MSRSLLAVLFMAAAFPSMAFAQPPDADGSQSMITAAPEVSTVAGQQHWLLQDLDDAKDRSRRARNALIATSATVGLGTIFTAIGASQCQLVSQPGQNDEVLCNSAGDVLFPLGFGAVVLGGIGMITSGIILGVSNKRQRQIKGKLRSGQYGRRLQFDATSGGFVF
jgi:hypothetical protein